MIRYSIRRVRGRLLQYLVLEDAWFCPATTSAHCLSVLPIAHNVCNHDKEHTPCIATTSPSLNFVTNVASLWTRAIEFYVESAASLVRGDEDGAAWSLVGQPVLRQVVGKDMIASWVGLVMIPDSPTLDHVGRGCSTAVVFGGAGAGGSGKRGGSGLCGTWAIVVFLGSGSDHLHDLVFGMLQILHNHLGLGYAVHNDQNGATDAHIFSRHLGKAIHSGLRQSPSQVVLEGRVDVAQPLIVAVRDLRLQLK